MTNLYEQWNIHAEALKEVDRYTEAALEELRALSVDTSALEHIISTLTGRAV